MTSLRGGGTNVALWSQRRLTAVLLALSFVYLILCTPFNLIHGFLYCEEATAYLRYARMTPPLIALLAPHQQYYEFIPNAVTLIGGRILPLSMAGIFSAYVVLLLHLLTVYFALTCERFEDNQTKILVAAVVLLTPGMSIVMVGSTQAQFVLSLQCILVLISDPWRHRFSRTLCVLLGGLDGVVSCLLTPFFLYRAWRTRSRTAWAQASILCAFTGIQAVVLHHAIPFATRARIGPRSVSTYINVLSNHVLVLPFLSRLVYHPVSLIGHYPAWVSLVFSALSIVGFGLLTRVIWPAGRLARALLLIGLFHGTCCMLGMEGPSSEILGGGERYFFVCAGAIELSLVLLFKKAPYRSVASKLICLLLLSGLLDELRMWRTNQSGTAWTQQVRSWQQNPHHFSFTGTPGFCARDRFYLTPEPVQIRVPFYIFDSNTRPDVKEHFPKQIFGPNPAD